ncbi:MAG: SGNH/GDSL hydrolase family protein [Frankia sp.]
MRSRSLSRVLRLGLATAIVAAGCGSVGPARPAAPRPSARPTAIPAERATTPAERSAAPAQPLTGRYVAMGSSFAAGTGIGPDIGNGCLRSARDYPHLLAARLGLDLTDVTCGGATTANLLSTPQGGHPPQLGAVTATTRLVTITVGGNDLDYSAATAVCLAATRLGRACTAIPSPGETSEAAETLRVHLVRLLRAVATTALTYLVTYLRVFPDPATTCAGNVISTEDSTRLAAIGSTLQSTLRRAAADAGVPLVDAYTAGTGHDVCAAPARRWVEGSNATGTKYHPDANGAAAIATLVAETLARRTSGPASGRHRRP